MGKNRKKNQHSRGGNYGQYSKKDVEYYHDELLNFLKNEGNYMAKNTLVSEKQKLFSKIEKNTGVQINYMGNAISPDKIKDSEYFLPGDFFENPKWKTEYTVMLGISADLDGTKTLKTKPHIESNSGDLYFKDDFTKTSYVDLNDSMILVGM